MLQRLRHRAQGQEGFTLIELLVVILIIGILAAVAIPAFLNQKNKASDSNVKSDINTAQLAEESYSANNNTYVNASGTTTSNLLLAAEPSLKTAFTTGTGNEQMAVTNASAQGYTITAYDPNGTSFVLTRGTDGSLTRTCTVQAGFDPGGCKGASQVSTGT